MARLPTAHVLLIWLAGAVCVLATMGRASLNRHEVYAAEPAREMLAGHGVILQPFAGQYRTKKPPGQSWLIAATLAVVRVRNEWTARLPSAVAGIGTAWVVAVLANRPGRPWRGLIAGLMVLTGWAIQDRIRSAEADSALALAATLANALVLRAIAGGPAKRRRAVGFWACVVAGFLLKGPVILVFTLLPALGAWAVLRFWRADRPAATAVARVAFWWPAVLGGVVLIAAWPLAALKVYPEAWAQWKYEVIDRSRGTLGHNGTHRFDPVLTYVWALPFGLVPWVFFMPAAAVLAYRNRAWRRPAAVYVFCWGACGFVVLSAVAFKTLHYALPMVPAFVLALAAGYDAVLAGWLRRRPVGSRARWRNAALAAWFGSAVVGWAVYQGVVAPAREHDTEVVHFSKRVNKAMPAGQTLYLFNLMEEQTAWYLNSPLRQTAELPPKPAYVLCAAGDLDALKDAGTVTILERAKPYLSREKPEEHRLLVRFE